MTIYTEVHYPLPTPTPTPTATLTHNDLIHLYPDQASFLEGLPEVVIIHNGLMVNKLYNRIGVSDGKAYYKETSKFITIKKG